MFATVIYSYNYSSYAVWVLGSVGAAYGLARAFSKMPKLAASLLGYSIAIVAAFAMGWLRIDGFVSLDLGFYAYLGSMVFSTWSDYYEVVSGILFDLLPLYYAYRFLTTTSRDSVRFAVIPALAAGFLIFRGVNNAFIWYAYRLSIFVLPTIHVLVAGLFFFKGRRADLPNTSMNSANSSSDANVQPQ